MNWNPMLYLVQISRFVVAFIFLYSFVTKMLDFSAFERAIQNFQLLPKGLNRLSAYTFMLGEASIFMAAFSGENWLFLSHILAIVLLVIFSYALNSVLKREMQVSCNCFGTSEQSVSSYDIWRNQGIIFVSVLGLFALLWDKSSLNLVDSALSALIALVTCLLLLNLRVLIELFA